MLVISIRDCLNQNMNQLNYDSKNHIDNLPDLQLGSALASVGVFTPESTSYIQKLSAERVMRLGRLSWLLGMLAPGGTAPRTALEQIYIQAGENRDESPIVLDLRKMLESHWGEWTPALREAEGLAPAEKQ